MDTLIPRGIRNNNPLNIRISDDAWQGRVPAGQQTDKAFFQFVTFYHGFRAAMKLLRNYVTIHNCLSIEQIISRWAPRCENATDSYISMVCKMMAQDRFYQIPVSKGAITDILPLFRLAASMAVIESTKRVWMDAARKEQAVRAACHLAEECKLPNVLPIEVDVMYAFLDRLTSPNLLSSSPEGQSSFNNRALPDREANIAKQSSPRV